MHVVVWIAAGLCGIALALPGPAGAAGIPDRITLGALEQYYVPVSFAHGQHIKALQDCGVCHHHTTGTQVGDQSCIRCHRTSDPTSRVACQACHVKEPFSAEVIQQREKNAMAYHQDTPGLKGAYHQSCLGCHQKMGAPTGCQDCHRRKTAGDELFRAGAYAPQSKPGKSGGH